MFNDISNHVAATSESIEEWYVELLQDSNKLGKVDTLVWAAYCAEIGLHIDNSEYVTLELSVYQTTKDTIRNLKMLALRVCKTDDEDYINMSHKLTVAQLAMNIEYLDLLFVCWRKSKNNV